MPDTHMPGRTPWRGARPETGGYRDRHLARAAQRRMVRALHAERDDMPAGHRRLRAQPAARPRPQADFEPDDRTADVGRFCLPGRRTALASGGTGDTSARRSRGDRSCRNERNARGARHSFGTGPRRHGDPRDAQRLAHLSCRQEVRHRYAYPFLRTSAGFRRATRCTSEPASGQAWDADIVLAPRHAASFAKQTPLFALGRE